MPRPAVHPIVAPALIGVWLALLLTAVGKVSDASRKEHGEWLHLAGAQAGEAGPIPFGEWTVIHRPPNCSCDDPRMATELAELADLALHVRPIEAAHAPYDMVILAPDGRVAYAGGVDIPSDALCSSSMRTPADLLKAGWLRADIPILDRPRPCTCPARA